MVLSAVKKLRLKYLEPFCSKKARLNYSNIPVTQYKGFHLPDPWIHNQLQLQHVLWMKASPLHFHKLGKPDYGDDHIQKQSPHHLHSMHAYNNDQQLLMTGPGATNQRKKMLCFIVHIDIWVFRMLIFVIV